MRVYCSACADWPRALQKHKQRATTPALSSTQVTLSHEAERQLTREKLLHIHSACLSTAARACSSTGALAKREEKTIDLGAQFLLATTSRVRRTQRRRGPLHGASSNACNTAGRRSRRARISLCISRRPPAVPPPRRPHDAALETQLGNAFSSDVCDDGPASTQPARRQFALSATIGWSVRGSPPPPAPASYPRDSHSHLSAKTTAVAWHSKPVWPRPKPRRSSQTCRPSAQRLGARPSGVS